MNMLRGATLMAGSVVTLSLLPGCGQEPQQQLPRAEVEWMATVQVLEAVVDRSYAGPDLRLICLEGVTGPVPAAVDVSGTSLVLSTDPSDCTADESSALRSRVDGGPAARVVLESYQANGDGGVRVTGHWYEHGTSREDFSCRVPPPGGDRPVVCETVAVA